MDRLLIAAQPQEKISPQRHQDHKETRRKHFVNSVSFAALWLKIIIACGALMMFLAVPAMADCANPAGEEGVIVYNITHKTMQFCNGTQWIGMAGGISGGGLPDCPVGESLLMSADGWECGGGDLDTTPSAFSFADQTGVAPNTPITSGSIVIAGINAETPVSVSGDGSPKIRIGGTGSWVSAGTITNGQSIEVRLTSASAANTTRSAIVIVGGMTDNWSVTTQNAVTVYMWQGRGWPGHCGWNTSPWYCAASLSGTESPFTPGCYQNVSLAGTCVANVDCPYSGTDWNAAGTCP